MANVSRVLATVDRVTGVGEGVWEVVLRVPARYTRFVPGQFLHLTLDKFDPTTGYWPESRVFSIASEPKQDHLTIIYSVKGTYTQRMATELFVGREVWVKLPYGDFVIRDDSESARPLVLIAGGTGVSPYIPYLLRADLPTEGAVIHLFYGVREPSLVLFDTELMAVAKRCPRLRLHFVAETKAESRLGFASGRLNIADVQKELGGEFSQSVFYLSGPPPMIKSFQATLHGLDISANQIKIDEWE